GSQLVGFVFLLHREAAGVAFATGTPFFGHHISALRRRTRSTARRPSAARWCRAGARSSGLAATGCALAGAAGFTAVRALSPGGLARRRRARGALAGPG